MYGRKINRVLLKSTYGYFPDPLLPCLHPASKDFRSFRPSAALRPIRYDLSEDVTPLTARDRSRLLFHEFSWLLPAFAENGVRGGRTIKS